MTATQPLLGPGADQLAEALGVDLLGALEVDRATGKTGEIVQIPAPLGIPGNPQLRLVLLVGVGDQRPTDFRRAGAALARAVRDRATLATSIPALEPHRRPRGVRRRRDARFVRLPLALLRARASTGRARSSSPSSAADDREVLDRAVALGTAGWRARVLATVPSNLKTPAWLAEQAQALAADHGLKCRVWDEKQLEAEGFGGIIGVGRGSAHPPRLVRHRLHPQEGAPLAPPPSHSLARGSPSTPAA